MRYEPPCNIISYDDFLLARMRKDADLRDPTSVRLITPHIGPSTRVISVKRPDPFGTSQLTSHRFAICDGPADYVIASFLDISLDVWEVLSSWQIEQVLALLGTFEELENRPPPNELADLSVGIVESEPGVFFDDHDFDDG